MPRIAEICNTINQVIADNASTAALFKGGNLLGLAEKTKRTDTNTDSEVSYPLLMDTNGGVFDDGNIKQGFSIQVYHRINGKIESEADEEKSSGDINNIATINTPMIMVIFMNRKTLQVRPEDVANSISIVLPTNIDITNVDVTEIERGDINLNGDEVWLAEFDQAESIAPDRAVFSIEYNIYQQVDSRCFTVC